MLAMQRTKSAVWHATNSQATSDLIADRQNLGITAAKRPITPFCSAGTSATFGYQHSAPNWQAVLET
jgi:hypothetical protein